MALETRYQEALTLLPKLSAAQRKEMAARLKLLMAPSTERKPVDIVVPVMRRILGDLVPPPYVLEKHQKYPAFCRQCGILLEFIQRYGVIQTDLSQLLTIILRECVRSLEQKRIPVCIWSVGNRFVGVGALIEDAYPGYAQAGVLSAIAAGTWPRKS